MVSPEFAGIPKHPDKEIRTLQLNVLFHNPWCCTSAFTAYIPAVIAFLSRVPWEKPDDPIGRLAHFKKVNGLSFKRLWELMGRDPEQLEDWLSARHVPCKKNVRQIEKFLSERDPR